jgi:hypothetical protein
MPCARFPPISTRPESGASSPASMLIKVVFPEPVKPTIETNWPSSTDSLTFLNTSRVLCRNRTI